MADPPLPEARVRLRLPATGERLFSPRRILLAVVLAAALAFAGVVFARNPTPGAAGPATSAAVQQYLPSKPGSHILRQSQIGVILKPGFDGRISLNGVAIPEDQMDGAVPATSKTYNPKLGVRPNNKNVVAFTPGPDKVFHQLPTGSIEVTVRYWRTAEGPSTARILSWHVVSS